MLYTVTTVIRSAGIDAGEPVTVQWYKGESLAVAMGAMAQAAARHEDIDDTVPESVRTKTLSVTLSIEEN